MTSIRSRFFLSPERCLNRFELAGKEKGKQMIKPSFSVQRSPHFSVLSKDQVYEIHRASLEVLEKTGYKIESKVALDLLKQAGARVNGNIVKTPQHIIEECLRVAPKGFVLYDRAGNRALEVEGNKCYFGSSCASPNTRDAPDDSARSAKRCADIGRVTQHRLYHAHGMPPGCCGASGRPL